MHRARLLRSRRRYRQDIRTERPVAVIARDLGHPPVRAYAASRSQTWCTSRRARTHGPKRASLSSADRLVPTRLARGLETGRLDADLTHSGRTPPSLQRNRAWESATRFGPSRGFTCGTVQRSTTPSGSTGTVLLRQLPANRSEDSKSHALCWAQGRPNRVPMFSAKGTGTTAALAG